MMDIQKEEFIKRLKSTFVYDLLSQTLTDEQLFEHVMDTNGDIIWFKDQTRQMWFMWQQAQKVAVPDTTAIVLTLENVQTEVSHSSFVTLDADNESEIYAVDATKLSKYIDDLIEAQGQA